MKIIGHTTPEQLEALRVEANTSGKVDFFEDNEVVGIDNEGCPIQWGNDCGFYHCGEPMKEWGWNNLHPHEVKRLKNQGVIA